MSRMDLVKGIAIGALAGAAMGAAMAPRKKTVKNVAGRALRAAGEIVENLTDAMGK